MVEGVYTLPVLRTLQAGGVAAAELLDLLGKPLEPAERDKALAIVRANGGVDAARATATEWADRAVAHLADLPRVPGNGGDRAPPPHVPSCSTSDPRRAIQALGASLTSFAAAL